MMQMAKNLRSPGAAGSGTPAVHRGADRSDDWRSDGELRDAWRSEHRRAKSTNRVRRTARHRTDIRQTHSEGFQRSEFLLERGCSTSCRPTGDEAGDRPRAAVHGRRRDARHLPPETIPVIDTVPRPSPPKPPGITPSCRATRSNTCQLEQSASSSGSTTCTPLWRARTPERAIDRCTLPAPTEKGRWRRWSRRRCVPPAIAPAATTSPHLVDLTDGSPWTACRSASVDEERGDDRARDAASACRHGASSTCTQRSSSDHGDRVRKCSGAQGGVARLRCRPRRPSRCHQRLLPMACAITSIATITLNTWVIARVDCGGESRHHQTWGPVVLGPLASGPARVIAEVAAERGAPVFGALDEVQFAQCDKMRWASLSDAHVASRLR